MTKSTNMSGCSTNSGGSTGGAVSATATSGAGALVGPVTGGADGISW